MNDLDEQRIRNLRMAGWGYKAIAAFCGLSRDQVRSYCTTRQLAASSSVVRTVCAWCGSQIEAQRPHAKYCSPACRHKAWRHTRKAEHLLERECACCGGSFTVVDKPAQRFCCHACYVRHRFGTRGGRR